MSAPVVAVEDCPTCGAPCAAGAERCVACLAFDAKLEAAMHAVDLVLVDLRAAAVPGLGAALDAVRPGWNDITGGPMLALRAAVELLSAELAASSRAHAVVDPARALALARHMEARAALLGRVVAALALATEVA